MDVLAKFTLANKKQTASAHAGVAQEPPALGRILIERKKSRGARAQRYFQVVFSRHSQAIAQWDVVNEPIETGYRVDGLRNSPFLPNLFERRPAGRRAGPLSQGHRRISAVNPDQWTGRQQMQGLGGEVRHHAPFIEPHVRAVGVEAAVHARDQAMAGAEISHQGSDKALSFIVARTRPNGVDVTAVTTPRFADWIAVLLGRPQEGGCHRKDTAGSIA
jgi:hypothetical protein